MEVLRETTLDSGGVVVDDVQRLTKSFLDTDDVPVLQSQLNALEMCMQSAGTSTINYQDQIGLQHDFGIEVSASAEIETLLAEGAEHVHTLYTFRSVGRAIPMQSDPNLPNKHELDMQTFQVLQPQIAKIRRLMEFQEKGILVIERCMKSLVTPDARARVVPDGYYDALTKVIDLLQKLDNLKDMKASLTTDFSRYNRVISTLRADLENGDQLAQEKHKLQLFLSNFQYPKSLIFQNLRDVLKKIPGHEEVLIEMLQQNVDFIENERYLTPDEKYRLVRSLPHLVLLIDGDVVAGSSDDKKKNVFKDKRINLKQLQAIFKQYPIVPEYGDMSMTMLAILRRTPHWDPSMEKAWGSEPDKKVVARYSLLSHWPEMKSKHFEFLSRFSKTTTELSTYKFLKGLSATKYAKFVSDLVSDGFKLLQTWTCAVLEAYHWKLTHPKSPEELRQLGAKNPGGTGPYEAAVRYNYSVRERGVLVDVVSMIKSLASELAMAEAAVAPYIRLHIHHELQQFVTGELLPPLHRAHKRKRDILDPLLKLRRLVADWGVDSPEPADDYVKYSRQDGRVESKHPVRVVGPSPTQLQLMRTMVRSIYDPRNQFRAGMFSKKDLEKEDLQLMETFYNNSLSFQYLLNYSDTLHANSDLADLWYREFYLELSGQIQFPIELSLPWILTEHVIRHQAESMPLVENVLYTMDPYNDAAHRALYVLDQRFLYDEIEAELNLVFDQLVFLIADYSYSHHKDTAAARALDDPYVDRLRQSRKASKKLVDPPSRRLGIPLSQRRVQLLGRIVDLNHLISQQVNAKLYKDVEFCLKKFEASELSTIIDYERALNVVELTRDSLAEQLELDPFDVIVAEVDEAVGPAAFAGRALMHVLGSLVTDVIPNFSYNTSTRRFVRSPAVLKPVDRPKAPKADHQHLGFGARCQRAYDMVNKLHRGFVGVQHARSIIRVLGSSAVPLLVNNLLANTAEKLEISKAYLDAITEGLPPCKLPKSMYGLAGVYGVFDALLKPILAYQDLKPEVFQAFKEIGNTLLFVRDLSDVLDRQDLERQVHAVAYVDPMTRVLAVRRMKKKKDDESAPMTVKDAFAAVVELNGTTPLADAAKAVTNSVDDSQIRVNRREVVDLASTAALLHRSIVADRAKVPPPPRRSRTPKTSLFHGAVEQLATYIDGYKSSWSSSDASNGVFDVEGTKDFHRLWSALFFLFGVQQGTYKVEEDSSKKIVNATDEAQFGHGFFVAGAAVVHLLGHKSRFDALDFTNHVLRVRVTQAYAVNKAQGVGTNQSLDKDAENFARLKFKHTRVFQASIDMFQAVASDVGEKPLSVIFRAPQTDADIDNGARSKIAIKQQKTSSPSTAGKPPPPPPSKKATDESVVIKPPKPPPPMPKPSASEIERKVNKPPPPMPIPRGAVSSSEEEDEDVVQAPSSKPPPPLMPKSQTRDGGKPPPPPPMPQTNKLKAPPPPPVMPSSTPSSDDDEREAVDASKSSAKLPPPMPPSVPRPPPVMPASYPSSDDDDDDNEEAHTKTAAKIPPPMPSTISRPPPMMPASRPSTDDDDDDEDEPALYDQAMKLPPSMPPPMPRPPPMMPVSCDSTDDEDEDDSESAPLGFKPPPPKPKAPPPMPKTNLNPPPPMPKATPKPPPPLPKSSFKAPPPMPTESSKPPRPVPATKVQPPTKSKPPAPKKAATTTPGPPGPRPSLPFLAGINKMRQE